MSGHSRVDRGLSVEGAMAAMDIEWSFPQLNPVGRWSSSHIMQNLRDIAFEEIVPGYSRGQYGDFKVIIQMDSGYINVTHLCKLAASRNGEGKQFAHWKALRSSQEYLDAVSASLAITRGDLIVTVAGVHGRP